MFDISSEISKMYVKLGLIGIYNSFEHLWILQKQNKKQLEIGLCIS